MTDSERPRPWSIVRASMARHPYSTAMLLLAAVFVWTNRLPITGRAVPIWDAKDSFFPFFVLVADHARAGRLVFWDPWSNAGLPRFADPEFGAFSPVQLVVALLFGGTTAGFIAYWLLLWGVGGIGIVVLARHVGAPAWGAVAVGAGYLFSGIYTGHAEHLSWLVGFSALPFIIWQIDTALTERRFFPAVVGGAVWGVSGTAAYPGLTILTGPFLALWTVGRLLCANGSPYRAGGGWAQAHKGSPLSAWTFGGLMVLVATVTSLLILLPTYFSFFYENAGMHSRVDPLPRAVAVSNNALHPGALITLVSPYFSALKFHRADLWSYTDVSSCSMYFGGIGFALATVAIVVRPRDRWRWFLAALAASSIALALGHALPFRGWLYDWFYPARFFRHASIFRFYGVFALAVLALYGSRDLEEIVRGSAAVLWRRVVVTVAGLSIAAVAIYALATPGGDFPREARRLGHLHLALTWGAAIAVVVAGSLMASKLRLRWLPILLCAVALCDAVVSGALTRPTMFSTAVHDLEWWDRQKNVHSSALELGARGFLRTRWACESNPPCGEPNAWAMITKVPALNTYTPAINQWQEAIAAHPILSQLAVGSNRVWFAPATEVTPPDQAAFAATVAASETRGAPPLLLHPRELMMGRSVIRTASPESRIAALPAAAPITATVTRYAPGNVTFSVMAPGPGWLLVTDRWARSWTASVNGRPERVFGGNFVFRAVRVSAGPNRVAFVYAPYAFPWLLGIGWGTLALVAAAAVVLHRRRPLMTSVGSTCTETHR